MKKFVFPALLVMAAMFTSCGSNDPVVEGRDMPALEQEWTQAIKASYPEWKAPDYAPVK